MMSMDITKNCFGRYAILFTMVTIQFPSQQKYLSKHTDQKGNTYYLSISGNDKNNGNKESPWKTIQKLNSIQLKPGDSVLFEAGQTFYGTVIVDSNESGTSNNPIVFSSNSNGKAIINTGDSSAIVVNSAGYLNINHLNCIGAGRKNGNTKNGVAILNGYNILIDDLDIKGFQKAGLLIYSSSNIAAKNVYAHENGFAGISVSGAQSKEDCHNVLISNCKAENNPGDPSNFDNHSGNGIIAGVCKNVTIQYCVATNNGWDMPRTDNGPVGIWCYEADSVSIQYCISYRNKTSPGAEDGGGYDLDGGVTNSIIQYCLSYENQGSAFGIFQYAGASNWNNNTIRYNISENDGNVSSAHAGVFVWNGSRDDKQFKDLWFYNNVIYNDKGAAISYASESENAGFRFYNNIFVAKDTLVTGKESPVVYLANDWWSLSGGFNMDSIKNLDSWAHQKNKEQLDNKVTGLNILPHFANPGKTQLTDPLQLNTFFNYRLPVNSRLRNSGLDLQMLYGIDTGKKDFNQQPILLNGIGASF